MSPASDHKSTHRMLKEFHDEREAQGLKLLPTNQSTGKFELTSSNKVSKEYTVDFKNYLNVQYTGPMYFGTPQQGTADQ